MVRRTGSGALIALTTFPNLRSAKKAALYLVQSKFAACVNVIPVHESIYRWKGNICRDREFLLVIKTTKNGVAKIRKTLEKIHPYTCPELIWFEISGGSQDYLDWLFTCVQSSS